VAPMPNRVALRCLSELLRGSFLVDLPFLVGRAPKARSESADDEDELAKLKNPFLVLCLGLLLLDDLEKKPVNMLSCCGEDEREAFADVRLCELASPRI